MDDDRDACQIFHIDEEKVLKLKAGLIGEYKALTLSEIFKALGDPTRVKILYTLMENELCVCDIASLLGMTVSAISHQLRLLRNLKIVKYRKEGKMVYYSLDDEHIKKLLEMGVTHVEE
ncbi:cadmium resistance transcriptional regulatory protein CadC [archaeon BMS3Abin16]|nr:cadmium resistance transcriptional regulatory protein CadC [archaeon BMS3Abin16]HDY74776.1 ArsR family transcriptional regulator [Euryarchaeota archaeon]